MSVVDLETAIGRAIKRERKRAGYTQAELARRAERVGLHTSQSTVSLYEKGQSLDLNVLIRLALTLGVSPLALLLPDVKDAVDLGVGEPQSAWTLVPWFVGMKAPQSWNREHFGEPEGTSGQGLRTNPVPLARQLEQIQANAVGEFVFRHGLDHHLVPRAYNADPLWQHPDADERGYFNPSEDDE